MPDFDLDSAFAKDEPKLWSGSVQRNTHRRVTGAWLLYCLDPVSNTTKVAHDFKFTVDIWRRNNVDADTACERMRKLVAYMNQLSAENPDKPYWPHYEHQSVWSWVYDVAGDLDDPSIDDL